MTFTDLIHWNRPTNIPVQHRNRFGRSILSLQDDMDRMFQDFFGGASLPVLAQRQSFPAIDIVENKKNFKVKAELAGIDPEDVEISVTDGFLTVQGEKKEETEEEENDYLRREVSYGSFQRVLALPETADCDGAEASFKNGVLNIKIPKKAEALQKPKKLDIKKVA